MKNTSTIVWLLVAVALVWFFFFREGSADHDGLNFALERAQATNKLVLIDFTGSDWCGWCKELDQQTLSRPEFRDFAAKNLEIVVVDFPKNRELPGDEAAQNRSLKTHYGVQGFPTLVLLDAGGREIGRQRGFLPGGPTAMITWIESARAGGG